MLHFRFVQNLITGSAYAPMVVIIYAPYIGRRVSQCANGHTHGIGYLVFCFSIRETIVTTAAGIIFNISLFQTSGRSLWNFRQFVGMIFGRCNDITAIFTGLRGGICCCRAGIVFLNCAGSLAICADPCVAGAGLVQIGGTPLVFLGFYVSIAADGTDAVFRTSGYTALVGLCEKDFVTAGAVFVMLTAIPGPIHIYMGMVVLQRREGEFHDQNCPVFQAAGCCLSVDSGLRIGRKGIPGFGLEGNGKLVRHTIAERVVGIHILLGGHVRPMDSVDHIRQIDHGGVFISAFFYYGIGGLVAVYGLGNG